MPRCGVGADDILLDRDPAPLPKRGAEPPPQFSAHVYCGQTAEWIQIALGMEVGLGPGHIVLDGDAAPLPRKGTEAPIFGPLLQRAAMLALQAQCSHCKRCTSYSNSVRPSVRLSVCLSVCLSVRLSHYSIVSKRLHVARCSLHCQIAKCV